MSRAPRVRWFAGLLAVLCCAPLGAAERVVIGLAGNGAPIEALVVEARGRQVRTVVLLGGLAGADEASAAGVRAAVQQYERGRTRPVRLLAVPVANPAGAALAFPPTGIAYREQAESHTLWRWLGAQAPDLVLLAGDGHAGLATALGTHAVADMGRIPARAWSGDIASLAREGSIAPSEAATELARRRGRSSADLARLLARHYGRDFDQPWYIAAVALVGRARLGELDDVRRLAEPWVDGSKDPLARPNALAMAGHVVFTELARRTGDARYLAAVRRVADMGFEPDGRLREAMPAHDRYSDSVFMGTTILAQAGALTGERRYFDMADRHLRFMQGLVLRPDGLYRHRDTADVAWGRGNGFAAIGLALSLSELPRDHPGHAHALRSYRALMAALLPFQDRDGLWRNVVDHPGAYPEYSATAMIGFALERGLARGWLRGSQWRRAADRAFLAVNSRTADNGSLLDVCESTANLTTLQQYLHRAALLGPDPRGGAMALLFATELMQGRNPPLPAR